MMAEGSRMAIDADRDGDRAYWIPSAKVEPESKRMRPDANRSHSIPGFQWETMLETKIGNHQKTLEIQAFTRSVPAKAGIQGP